VRRLPHDHLAPERPHLQPQQRLVGRGALAAIPPAEDPGRVQSGPLLGVISIARDESKTPGLDDGRFTTLTTILGLPGFWITSWRSLASPGSDFSLGQYARVMDLIAALYRQGLLKYLNESLRVNSDGTGTINEKDARRIEIFIEDYIRNGLPAFTITSLTVTVNRTNNLLATQNLRAPAAPFRSGTRRRSPATSASPAPRSP
jgi:hypothetical protein